MSSIWECFLDNADIEYFPPVTLQFWYFLEMRLFDVFKVFDVFFFIFKKFFKKLEFVCVGHLLGTILRTKWKLCIFLVLHVNFNGLLENRIINYFSRCNFTFCIFKKCLKKYKFVCVRLLLRSIFRTTWKLNILLVLHLNFDIF